MSTTPSTSTAATGASATAEDRSPEGTVRAPDGPTLHWYGRLGDGPAKAVLLFVHGLAEHSGRYGWPMEYFLPRGFACYAFDLRGHGRSGGTSVHVRHFDDYDDDVGAIVRLVKGRHPGTPLFLVGHSMGGVVALRHALGHAEQLDGLVLSSPGFDAHPDLRPPAWLANLARLLSTLAPSLLIRSDLDPSRISRDPAVVEAYRNDPLVSNKVSARWFTSFVAAQKDVFERADDLRRPVLLMQSEADLLVDPRATARWSELAPPDLVSYYTWPGFYHEMFNEPERLRVYELVERWLSDRLAAPT